jgi:phosphoribosylglycinamide formyltransferase-1
MSSNKKSLAVFASGTGTNTIAIHRHFKANPFVEISLICSNNPKAGILQNPEVSHISKWVFTKEELKDEQTVLSKMKDHQIDFIVLAGFLWLIPAFLISRFPDKILNIHPALLPKYGGKGMYGMNVHRAVLESGDNESGITIHRVNEKYDEGNILFQATCDIQGCKTPEEIASRIHELEHFYYPRIINQALQA